MRRIVRCGKDWMAVRASLVSAGKLTIAIGDPLARWTNDRYRSILHQVIDPSERDR